MFIIIIWLRYNQRVFILSLRRIFYMRKLWKYNIRQPDFHSHNLQFCKSLTSVLLLILLYSTQSSLLLLLTPLRVFAEISQILSTENIKFQTDGNNSSEISATSGIGANTNTTNIKSATINSSGTVMEKLSDKAMYRIQLRSNESFVLLPKHGFDMRILFLNANASSSTSIIKE